MPVKNRIKYWRLQLGIHDEQQFADIIGFSTWAIGRWESQRTQPTLEALCRIRERLLPYFPGINLQDLIDYNPQG